MKLTIENPSKAYLSNYTQDELDYLVKTLTYKNTANEHLLKRHAKNHWFKSKNPEGWKIRYEELKKNVVKSVVFEENGRYFVRPGSIPYITDLSLEIENLIKYPITKKIPWAKPLPFTLHNYQQSSVEKMMQAKHCGVSITTGGGKSAIILKLLRELGLNTVVVVPSANIFNELLEKMEYHFGKGMVGGFGDGKKKIGKKFTIAISDSLVNVKKGTPEWDFFSKQEAFIADEAHTLPSETLEAVCYGVLSDIPYRLFFSATHERGDGALKLLQSITGPIVYSLTTSDAVKGGFICPHDFKIVEIGSSNPNFNTSDGMENKRIHFLRNKNIAAFAAKLANATATTRGEQTLILVEELNQISMLIPLLTVPYAYAHSESNKIKLEEIGLQKVDTADSIEKFNKGEVKVLIGTSCIHVGVNIFSMTNTINWIGGSSSIKTKQAAIGRSVRLGSHNPWKANHKEKMKCTIWDFDIYDAPSIEHQLKNRISSYEESGENLISYIKL